MSIFGNNTGLSYDVPVDESYTVLGGDMIAIEEAALDMEGVIESMYIHDMAELQRNKEVMALESARARDYEIARVKENYATVMENAVGDAWEKLKNMIKKLWGKIKGYFKNLIRFFDGFLLSGKKFAKKYENQLKGLSLSGFEVEMYNWDNDKLDKTTDVESYPVEVNKIINGEYKNKETLANGDATKIKTAALDKVRGFFIGGGAVKSSDYNEKLFGHFRNGARDKNDRRDEKVDIPAFVDALMDDTQLKAVKKLEKNIDREFNEKLKDLEDAKKEAERAENKDASLIAYNQKLCAVFNESHGIALTFVRAWKDAYVERNREYKNACVKAFRYKEDK